MFRLTRKGLWAHKLRYALTGLAVVLGVAFMSGTQILTDTMGKTFDGIFEDANEGVDVVVRRSASVESAFDVDVRERVDAAALARMKPSAFLINTSRAAIVESARRLPMMADRRVVIVHEAERLLAPKRGRDDTHVSGGDATRERPT